MKISYAILTHNEGEYIKNLLPFLIENKREEDEIVVVDDYSTEELTKSILEEYQDNIILHYREFDGDHTQKNYLNSKCTGDYIFQLDADEIIHKEFIIALPEMLKSNSNIELFYCPRINTVSGLTPEYVQKWGWRVNDKGWVNFPDFQMRLYKNTPDIKWEGLLHSKITGFKTYAPLPQEELYCILHLKDLDRQIQQNDLYDKIEENGRTKYKIQ
jgi:glycosyltransferase involved in cell wall biosynthesis